MPKFGCIGQMLAVEQKYQFEIIGAIRVNPYIRNSPSWNLGFSFGA